MDSKQLRNFSDGRVTVGNGGIQIRRIADSTDNGQLCAAACLAIDCSGSMSGGKIRQAREGALGFASEALAKGYAVGVVSFSSKANEIAPPSTVLDEFEGPVQRLNAGGSTDMTAGIELATAQLLDYLGPRAIVVVTDGMPDVRHTALEAASAAKRLGIDVITIGTDDADEGFLRLLSSRDDLAMTVNNAQLAEAMSSAALMLTEGVTK